MQVQLQGLSGASGPEQDAHMFQHISQVRHGRRTEIEPGGDQRLIEREPQR